MKKKIQKYLAGEREGFSLVELIIVIAIMAILIGVVTLAVLPNIAKSKESKDITALDSILSAVNSAVASQQVSTTGSFKFDISGSKATIDKTNGTATAKSVAAEVEKLLGKDAIDLASSAAQKGKTINCSWNFDNAPKIVIKVAITDGAATPTTIASDYNDNNGKKGFEVSN